MDQDSFRLLLSTAHPTGSSSTSGFTKSKAKGKVLDPSQPAFKPRKVKKNAAEGPYRDRAAERRGGEEGDYAQVEAVLEDFQKRSEGQDKSTLDAQRHYLGGDATHTVLVKGLDMALLEQNRARAALGPDGLADDESLEQAFAESQPPSKKRTREELIRALKAKRTGQTADAVEEEVEEEKERKGKSREEEARVLEEAKRAGKFRPIGFTPIGGGEMKKKKKAKDGVVEGEKRKKKKRRVDDSGNVDNGSMAGITTTQVKETDTTPAVTPLPTSLPIPPPLPARETEAEALPEDFDIFADAGDYEGIQLDSDSEAEDPKPKPRDHDMDDGPSRRWIDTGSPEPEAEPSKPDLLKSVLAASSAAAGPSQPEEMEEGEEDEERPMRLVPLASSALPSIKDFLAAEGAASGAGKRRKRKGGAGGEKGGEKKGADPSDEGKKKQNAEAKAERDYKRLKNYTDKKAAT
ncbi:hypothetical protein DXG01_010228 [Tephrocybe rancida]|nr:hypothetical protein DXG01_010228 [Tephrocybe rancida]